jgi:hypothetical protein
VSAMEDDFGFNSGNAGSDRLRPFVEELCSHVQEKGIVTMYSEMSGPQCWDVRRKSGGWTFGITREHTKSFYLRVMGILRGDGLMAVVLRSFTDRSDPETGLTVKEIRGYRVWLGEEAVCFQQIGAEDLAKMSRTDSFTGHDIGPEPAVVYVGPNGDRADGRMNIGGN